MLSGSNSNNLHEQLKLSNQAKFKELISNGADINAKNYYNETVLYLALKTGKLDFAWILLENNADLNTMAGLLGDTPLIAAVSYVIRHQNDKQLIITSKEQVPELIDSILKGIACEGEKEKIRGQLNQKTHLQIYNDYCLQRKINEDNTNKGLEIVKYMLDKGADAKSYSKKLIVPAIEAGSYEVAILLINNGVDVNATNFFGQGMLDLVFSSHLEKNKKISLINCLILKGIKIGLKTYAHIKTSKDILPLITEALLNGLRHKMENRQFDNLLPDWSTYEPVDAKNLMIQAAHETRNIELVEKFNMEIMNLDDAKGFKYDAANDIANLYIHGYLDEKYNFGHVDDGDKYMQRYIAALQFAVHSPTFKKIMLDYFSKDVISKIREYYPNDFPYAVKGSKQLVEEFIKEVADNNNISAKVSNI